MFKEVRIQKNLRISLLLLSIIIFTFFLNTSAGLVRAVEYGGIGGKPAYPRNENPRTESIFVHTVEPGQTVQEGIKVTNNTAESKNILVYSVDSEVATGGAFSCKQLSDEKADVGSWVSMQKTELNLDSLTSETVPFSIQIPKNASVGEHNGCIIIQEKKADSTQPGVNLTFRSGIRIALLIPGDIVRKLEIGDFEILEKENGLRILRPVVKNLGNVSVDANINIFTDYFFGTNYKKQGGQYPVLRDEVSDWNFEVEPPYWGGFYKSYFTVDYDASSSSSVGVNTGKEPISLKSKESWFFVFPQTPALIIEIAVLLLLLLIIGFIIRSVVIKSKIKKSWVQYTIESGDTINSLAHKFGVNWKTIAQANKIAAPYHLEPGNSIKVPPQKRVH